MGESSAPSRFIGRAGAGGAPALDRLVALVLNNESALHGRSCHRRQGLLIGRRRYHPLGPPAASGHRTRNVVPFSGADSIVSSAPWWSSTTATNDSPSPIPAL